MSILLNRLADIGPDGWFYVSHRWLCQSTDPADYPDYFDSLCLTAVVSPLSISSQLPRLRGGPSSCRYQYWDLLRLGLCGQWGRFQDGDEHWLEPLLQKYQEVNGQCEIRAATVRDRFTLLGSWRLWPLSMRRC